MLRIKPNRRCRVCSGTGEVIDYVPYGSEEVPMTSVCNCVLDQIADSDEQGEGVLVFDVVYCEEESDV